MSDDSADDDRDGSPGDAVPADEDVPASQLPEWLPAVLRGGATIVVAGLVLAVALAITNPDDSGSTDSPTGALLEAAPTTTAAPPQPDDVTSTTVAEAAATSNAAPATTGAPSPPTAPPSDAVEPIDERCPSYSVDEDLPVEICDRGALVAEVQTALNAAGFAVGIDGFFTSATEEAVIQFQAREGLEQDGLVGPRTAEALGVG